MSIWRKKETESGKPYVEEVQLETHSISISQPDREEIAAIRDHLSGKERAEFRKLSHWKDDRKLLSDEELVAVLRAVDGQVADHARVIAAAEGFTERLVAAGAPRPRDGRLYAQGIYAEGGWWGNARIAEWPPYGKGADRRVLLASVGKSPRLDCPRLEVHRVSKHTIDPANMTVGAVVAAARKLHKAEWPDVSDEMRALIEGPDFVREAA